MEAAFFERVISHIENKLPLVIYNQPESNSLQAFFQENDEVYSVDFNQKGFVFSAFDADKKSVFIPDEFADYQEVILNQQSAAFFQQPEIANQAFSIAKEEYIQQIDDLVATLKTTSIKKVVFSRPIKIPATLSINEQLYIFNNLLKTYKDAMVYFWHHPKIGTWLGATPERLLSTERNRLKTMALAGTKVAASADAVIWGEKEKEEQQIVVDSILASLAGKTSQLKLAETKTKQAGKLFHLHTEIQATFNPDDLQEIVESLHPTPAVGGLPKQAAIDYILSHEIYDRKFYTGFLGEINVPHVKMRAKTRRNQEVSALQAFVPQTNLYVNLRCMEYTDQQLIIYVGGGITAESKAEEEWEETENKSQTMLNVL
ncbi:MAG: chorismate-binding protein [Bacteroidota bacterium]